MNYQSKKTYLFNKYPAVEDVAYKAQKRIPKVAWEYLNTGTGEEALLQKNRAAFNAIQLRPQFCKGQLHPNIECTILGQKYAAPFGIAPIGLAGLIWPRAEILLAQAANLCQIPYSLSTVATETPESVGTHVGNMGWFQLYPPRERELRHSLLDRAKEAGFHTLIITVDVPAPSRRERTKRAGLQMPPKLTPNFLWQGMTHPHWAIETLRRGLPSLRTIADYSAFKDMMSVGNFTRDKLGGNLSWEMCAEIKEYWQGPVILKGILHPDDAQKAVEIGMDGIVISNHGARQFDAAPPSIDALPAIVAAVKGKTTILLDSGVRTGLDILRALHLGADFVLLGRAFMYGVAALGALGGAHVFHLLADDLKNNMQQLGIEELPKHL